MFRPPRICRLRPGFRRLLSARVYHRSETSSSNNPRTAPLAHNPPHRFSRARPLSYRQALPHVILKIFLDYIRADARHWPFGSRLGVVFGVCPLSWSKKTGETGRNGAVFAKIQRGRVYTPPQMPKIGGFRKSSADRKAFSGSSGASFHAVRRCVARCVVANCQRAPRSRGCRVAF